MKMKKLGIVSLMVLFLAFGVSGASATPTLWDWAFNLNGDSYYPYDTVPGLDDTGFDWNTGLGNITLTYDPGFAGDYYFLSFFDHEIEESPATFCNEYGATSGTPAPGQTWEIDEPGSVFGDIYDHVTAPWTYGFLDNSNGVPPTLPDDVSMAMGWNFTLGDGQWAVIDLILGEAIPSGFYLSHTDPDSAETIHFSSTLDIQGGGGPVAPVPEPCTMMLLGTGLVGLFGLRRKGFKKR
jgi:hypothetical protein